MKVIEKVDCPVSGGWPGTVSALTGACSVMLPEADSPAGATKPPTGLSDGTGPLHFTAGEVGSETFPAFSVMLNFSLLANVAL